MHGIAIICQFIIFLNAYQNFVVLLTILWRSAISLFFASSGVFISWVWMATRSLRMRFAVFMNIIITSYSSIADGAGICILNPEPTNYKHADQENNSSS